MSNTQKEYLEWFNGEKAKGLKDINYFFGGLPGAKTDDLLKESLSIDEAIAAGRYQPLSDTL